MKSNFHKVEDGCVLVEVDLGVYGIGPLLRAAYEMTDRCYIHLQSRSEHCVEARFRPKDGSDDGAADLAGVFCNELLDQALRAKLSAETEPVRNLILAHALSHTSLTEDLESVELGDDPLQVSVPDNDKST